MSSDRTEQATPKRREDARKQGRIARGPKLPAALGFLAAIAILKMTGEDWILCAKRLFISLFLQADGKIPLTLSSLQKMVMESSWLLVLLVFPVISAVMVAGLVGNFLQGGFLVSAKALVPRWERFNPAANVKRMWGGDALAENAKSLLELSLLSVVCYLALAQAIKDAPTLVGVSPGQIFLLIGTLAYRLCLRASLVMVFAAALDYGYRWYSYEKSLRMTKKEIKDEFREQEGDPMVKGQRRRAARALLQRRITLEVPRADVVVTNPTHFAVALVYNREKNSAPVVVAKGADLMARRIREIAMANDVMVVENPPLARALYRSVAIDQAIPPEFFRAVAELLAYVYQQKATRN